MERADAFRTLRLDQSADGRMVENAYWVLVRQAQQRASDDTAVSHDIDRLNEAYATLSPNARLYAPQSRPAGDGGSGLAFLDAFADWVNDEALRTRARWPRRNPEIALIGGAAIVLMVLALGAGASLWGVFVAMSIVLAAIWAPWRKPELPPDDRA